MEIILWSIGTLLASTLLGLLVAGLFLKERDHEQSDNSNGQFNSTDVSGDRRKAGNSWL